MQSGKNCKWKRLGEKSKGERKGGRGKKGSDEQREEGRRKGRMVAGKASKQRKRESL